MTDTAAAHVVSDGGEAVRIARELVPRLAAGADRRDAERKLPWAEIAEIRASGLLGITVPRCHGGAGATASTVAEALRLLGTVDLSLAQILQPHFAFLDSLPAESIVQLHFVGAERRGEEWIDSHGRATSPEIWDLFRAVAERAPVKAAILERDKDFPPFADALDEVRMAARIGREAGRWS